MKKNMKRAYHHSEAWLAKHEKLMAKRAAKGTMNKPGRKIKKDLKKRELKVKKMEVKADKKAAKEFTKELHKIFEGGRKQVSAVKKLTKTIGKFLTNAAKNPDPKAFARATKLFGILGYVYDPETGFVNWENNAKVKLPKVKAKKEEVVAEPTNEEKPKKLRRPRVKKDKGSEEETGGLNNPEETATPPADATDAGDDVPPQEVLVGDASDVEAAGDAGDVDDKDPENPDGEEEPEEEPEHSDDDDDDDDDEKKKDPSISVEEEREAMAATRRESWAGIDGADASGDVD